MGTVFLKELITGGLLAASVLSQNLLLCFNKGENLADFMTTNASLLRHTNDFRNPLLDRLHNKVISMIYMVLEGTLGLKQFLLLESWLSDHVV